MQRFDKTRFATMPWPNGRGITEEIAREGSQGGTLWRLSLARIAGDGPFSAFPGRARLLTVVEGAGIALAASGLALTARPWAPVAFPGVPAPECRLAAGPVRALNLIFDPVRLAARAMVEEGPGEIAGSALVWLSPVGAAAPPLAPGDAARIAPGETFALPVGARAVVFALAPVTPEAP